MFAKPQKIRHFLGNRDLKVVTRDPFEIYKRFHSVDRLVVRLVEVNLKDAGA